MLGYGPKRLAPPDNALDDLTKPIARGLRRVEPLAPVFYVRIPLTIRLCNVSSGLRDVAPEKRDCSEEKREPDEIPCRANQLLSTV